MDEMSFLEPVFLGEVVTVRATVNDVGRTSMEVGVRVDAENYYTGRKVHASSAYLVFVALDAEGKPRPVPPLVVETDIEQPRRRRARVPRRGSIHRGALRSGGPVRDERRRHEMAGPALDGRHRRGRAPGVTGSAALTA